MPETELKLMFAEADLPKVETLPLFSEGIAKARRRRAKSAYFDTPKWDLWKRGFTLRIRDLDGALIQTIKQEWLSVIDRGEWERQIDCLRCAEFAQAGVAKPDPAAPAATDLDMADAAMIDFAMIEETPLADMIGEAARGRLRRRFEVDVERADFPLTTANAAVEVAIDRGEIRSASAADHLIKVSELEIELKSGERRVAFALARALSAQAPLSLSLISKAERGQLLVAGAWGRPRKASEPRLKDDMTSVEAFSAVCRACLHDFMLNVAGLTAGPERDPVEAVHQGRIALRRLRAAFALFRPIACDNAFAKINRELRWMASAFGAARDRDVMSASAPEPARPGANGSAKDFFSWLEGKRRAAHRSVVRATQSKRWRIFLVDFCDWLDGGAWRQNVDRRKDDMRRFIRKRLNKRREALLERGRGLDSLAPDVRHKVRINAKKLRYAAQFFTPLSVIADRDQIDRMLRALDELQAALGELQDEQARREAARADIIAWRKWAGEADPSAVAAAERWAAPALDGGKQLKRALKAYAKLAKAKPF